MKDFQYLARIRHKITVILFFICLTTMFLIFPSSVFAHKVSIFAWVEGDTVHTQSIFFGGKKIKNATIEVLDASGKQLVEGETNDNGEFSFRTPIKAAMKIVVSAGMGHQGVWNLKASDFESTGHDIPYSEPASSPEKTNIHPPVSHAEIPSPQKAPPGVTSDEIMDIVEKALDKKLTPVLKMLSESRNRTPSIGDILGGIGYIIGLVGLAAYIGNRRKKDNLLK